MTSNIGTWQTGSVDPSAVPTPFAVAFGNTLYYLYLDVNSHITAIWRDDHGWHCCTLDHGVSPTPSLAQGSPVAAVYKNELDQDELHVLYLDASSKISDVYLRGNTWQSVVVTNVAISNAPLATTSPWAAIVNNCLQAVFVTKDGKLGNFCRFNKDEKQLVAYQDLTQASNATDHPNGTAANVFHSGQSHNVYRNTDDQIADIWLPEGQANYQHALLSGPGGKSPSAHGPHASPVSVFYRDYYHNLYRDVNNKISDIWFKAGIDEVMYQNLNDIVTSAPPAHSSPSSVVYDKGHHAVYLDSQGTISDLWYDSNRWRYQNLNTLVRIAPRPLGRPFSIVFKDEHHNLYIDQNNQISDIWYNGNSWQYQNILAPGASPPAVRRHSLVTNNTQPMLRFKKDSDGETWYYGLSQSSGDPTWLPLRGDRLQDAFTAAVSTTISLFVHVDIESGTDITVEVTSTNPSFNTQKQSIIGHDGRTRFDLNVELDDVGDCESFSVKVSWNSGTSTLFGRPRKSDPTFTISRNG